MLGDGVAIDPTGDTLHAPCDGEVVVIAAARHALTLRTPGGCEILLHVGIDTVALAGEGFTLRVRAGARVRAGEPLLSFDLDLLARRAKSLLTPVIITPTAAFASCAQRSAAHVAVGDFLMEVAPSASRRRRRRRRPARARRLTRDACACGSSTACTRVRRRCSPPRSRSSRPTCAWRARTRSQCAQHRRAHGARRAHGR